MKDVARPDYWVPDQDITQCNQCSQIFTVSMSKHHCRACGQGVCGPCSSHIRPVPSRGWDHPVRVCDGCHARTQSLWVFEKQEFLKSTLSHDDASPETAALIEHTAATPTGRSWNQHWLYVFVAALILPLYFIRLCDRLVSLKWWSHSRYQTHLVDLRRCDFNRLTSETETFQNRLCTQAWPFLFISVCTALQHAAQSFF